MTFAQYLGIVVLSGVSVGCLWYWIVQVPRNIRERNRETFQKFMAREDAEIRAVNQKLANLHSAATATRKERR